MNIDELQKFRHQIKVDVRYDDLDTLGHVNNKKYLSYLEESRISYHEEVLNFDKKSLDFSAVVARVDISYFTPILLGDKVQLFTRCSRVGSKSFDLETLIISVNTQKLASKSVVTLVSVDMKTGKSKENDANLVKKILEYEKVEPVLKQIL